MQKAGSDAEFVYATLYSYDQELQSSLEKEVKRVSQELGKLKDMNSTYKAGKANATKALDQPHPTAPATPVADQPHETHESTSNSAYSKKAADLKLITCFLQQGSLKGCTPPHGSEQKPGGTKQQLARTVRATQMLLAEHQELRGQFGDVFDAFIPARLTSLLQGTAKAKAHPAKVRLTRALRARTLQAMTQIQSALERQRKEVLLQTSVLEQRMSSQAAVAEAKSHAQQGIEAEEQQSVKELAFSSTFAEAVLRIDREFLKTVRDSVQKKANLVEAIRDCRDTQHRSLESLVDLLHGKYTVGKAPALPTAVAAMVGGAPEAPAFLQVASSGAPASQKALNQVSSLQVEIENALRKKADTHGILVRVKAMLDQAAPVDSDAVQRVVSDLSRVAQEINGEQSRTDEARQRCEAQTFHEDDEAQALGASFALMEAVRNRTRSSIQAAKQNLASIVGKTKALEDSATEFMKIVARTTTTLKEQSQDRRTIMVAVQKAREIVAQRTSAGPAADALLFQMSKELERQEEMELSYRSAEVAFRGAFLAYAGNYVQLLRERRNHYSSSLSSLELYADEVEGDLASQADAINSGKELKKESKDLCEDLLSFYERHRAARAELSRSLRAVLPQLPAVLSQNPA